MLVLATGMVTGSLTAYPLFTTLQARTEDAAAARASTWAAMLDAELLRLQTVTDQVASRSELALRLGAFNREQISLDSLYAFSEQRLRDAVNTMDELAALIRFDREGNEVIRLGAEASRLASLPAFRPGLQLTTLGSLTGDPADRQVLLVFSARIFSNAADPGNRSQEGHDILLFYPRVLERFVMMIQAQSTTRPDTCLINQSQNQRLAWQWAGTHFELTPVGGCLDNLPNGRQQFDETISYRNRLADGTRVTAFYRPLQTENWALHFVGRSNLLYQNLLQRALEVALILLLLTLLSVLLTRRLLRPLIERISEQATRIELADAELRLAASVFEQSQAAMLITDARGQVIRANSSFSEVTAIDPTCLRDHNLQHFVDQQHMAPDFLEQLRHQLKAFGTWQGEVWYRGSAGGVVPTLQTITAVSDNMGKIQQLIHVISDISERKRAEEHMQRLAHRDRLTGLPNREALETQIGLQLEDAAETHFAVLFIDLDRFKPINDQHGHQTGDRVLQVVARRLRAAVRSGDTVGRLGGDEFLVITSALEAGANAEAIAENIIEKLSQPMNVDSHLVSVGASIGIAFYPQHGAETRALLKCADAAMYRAKDEGRGRWCVATAPA